MKALMIKFALLATLISSLSFASVLAATAVDCSSPTSAKVQIQCGACAAAGTTDNCQPDTAPRTIEDTIKAVISVLSVIAGAVAVVMIILGGFRYVTSAGNAETTKSARNTILYALVGLVIIAMAQIIVHFTLNNVANGCVKNKTPTGQAC